MRPLFVLITAALLVLAAAPALAQDNDTPRVTDFNTLLAAVEAAGLTEELAEGGPYTVFAPTDGAFAAALDALGLTAEELLADTDTLTDILTYHLIEGEVSATDLIALIEASDGMAEVPTVNGATINAQLVDGVPYLNGTDTAVFLTDIDASNGVIHVIDGVLLPPADETAEAEETDSGTIVDTAAASPDFSTLVEAVTAAELVDTLSGEGPFTVFAPTNDAFAAALDALGLTAEELLADTDTLTDILTYHVIAGAFTAADVVALIEDGGGSAEVATVNGAPVTLTLDGENVLVNEAVVITPDITASNGVIHAVDAVILPPAE